MSVTPGHVEYLRNKLATAEAERDTLRAALTNISKGAKRYWREGDDAYQFAVLADAALSPRREGSGESA